MTTSEIPNDSDGLAAYTEAPPRPTSDSNIATHAWDELNREGLFTKDGDFYGGLTGRAVMDLVEVFVKQGHSGASGAVVIDLFRRLVMFQALSDLTDDPDEWMEVVDGLWQSRRRAEAFSSDGGRTYKLNSDPGVVYTSKRRKEEK